ncbi:DeoR family transcriptional regulator [Serratia fonticola]|jgi:DeoR family deoxyribose operon repressor|uniref:DeoR family transcriptional regulator n=1 Tax=Serratia fonticola TaxID=47917 RepID=A0A559TAH5_SERFO|nr:DeoR/GlpR family DNA-binding transcription regulator [Serratia fonticola]TQI80902.1 DeoR family transcriptional regulator [Serratia fonticola]TQI97073.1 DeoR family transcriptional regulator [Serratia fonticola]TVZ71569.1 DeoR family transcriptional regulator [Serratia fonticola]
MAMNRGERLTQILDVIKTNSMLKLGDIAKILSVSEMTIRRDIAASSGRLVQLGGYIFDSKNLPSEASSISEQHLDRHTSQKQLIGHKAIAHIQAGDTLFLDCGTTMPYLARNLPLDIPLTCICYSLNIAEILSRRSNISLLMLGGLYHPSSQSFSDEQALATLKNIGINKAFLSASGIHRTRGLSCSNFYEVAIKRTVVKNAIQKIVLADSSKFDVVKPMLFADLQDIDAIITDDDLMQEEREAFLELYPELKI